MKDRKKPEKFLPPHGMPSDGCEFAFSSRVPPKALTIKIPYTSWNYQVPIPGITKPGNSTPMAVSPDRRFLYVGTRGEPKVAAGFAIDSASGTLKYVASGSLADSMAYLSTDRTGHFLLRASYPGHKITVNPIGPPGTVQPP